MLKVEIFNVIMFFHDFRATKKDCMEVHKNCKSTQKERAEVSEELSECNKKLQVIADILNLDWKKCMTLARVYAKWGKKTNWQKSINFDSRENYERILNWLICKDKDGKHILSLNHEKLTGG